MDAAVFALGDLTADRLAVIDLVAIAAEIEPARVGILRDHAIRRADIARLVGLVMARHRKFQHVDLVAGKHVLEDRPVFHDARRDMLHRLDAVVILLDDVHFALAFERKSQRQRHPLDRREVAIQRAIALRESGDVVEQQRRRRAVAVLGQHVRDRAHLGVPVSAADPSQLAHLVDLLDPTSEAAIAALDQLQIRLAAGSRHDFPPTDCTKIRKYTNF